MQSGDSETKAISCCLLAHLLESQGISDGGIMELYHQAADLGLIVEVDFYMGWIYERGLYGVTKNPEEAQRYYERSIRRGFSAGAYSLAALMKSKIEEEDRGSDDRAEELYKFSVDRKVLKGLYRRAMSEELPPERQREYCRECLQVLEKQRPTNLLELHFAWMDKNNQLTAGENQEISALAGARISYDIRGFEQRFDKLLLSEKSGEKTFEDLLPMYEMLGEKGVSAAWVHIGKKYYEKKVQANIDKAISCFRQAIELGDKSGEALYRLGIIYETGTGIGGMTEKARKEEAKRFYREAAVKGHRHAKGAFDRLNSRCTIL